MKQKRLVACAATAACLVALSAGEAAARIHIPCTGDRIVKVMDGPGLLRMDGSKINLGYLFPGCFSEGRWIGHIGSSERYVELDKDQLQEVLTALKLKTPPPTPSRWQYPMDALLVEILTAAALAGFGGWELFKSLRKGEDA